MVAEDYDVVIDIKALGEKVKYYRQQLGLNIPELAAKAGIDKTQLSRLEKGTKGNITLETINKIALALNKKASELISESEISELLKPETQVDRLLEFKKAADNLGVKGIEFIGDVLQVPVRGYVRAGIPCVIDQEEGEIMIITRYVITPLTNRPNDVYALRVEGESISGDNAHTGDFLLILPMQEMDINRDLYIIRDPDNGESVVRHLRKEGDKIYVESSNPDYPPLVLPKVEVIGRVVWIQPLGMKPRKI